MLDELDHLGNFLVDFLGDGFELFAVDAVCDFCSIVAEEDIACELADAEVAHIAAGEGPERAFEYHRFEGFLEEGKAGLDEVMFDAPFDGEEAVVAGVVGEFGDFVGDSGEDELELEVDLFGGELLDIGFELVDVEFVGKGEAASCANEEGKVFDFAGEVGVAFFADELGEEGGVAGLDEGFGGAGPALEAFDSGEVKDLGYAVGGVAAFEVGVIDTADGYIFEVFGVVEEGCGEGGEGAEGVGDIEVYLVAVLDAVGDDLEYFPEFFVAIAFGDLDGLDAAFEVGGEVMGEAIGFGAAAFLLVFGALEPVGHEGFAGGEDVEGIACAPVFGYELGDSLLGVEYLCICLVLCVVVEIMCGRITIHAEERDENFATHDKREM